jgi:hypothetical protein
MYAYQLTSVMKTRKRMKAEEIMFGEITFVVHCITNKYIHSNKTGNLLSPRI